MFKIKVPATTANMGPGFDSFGMALSLYNTVCIDTIESGVEIEVKNQQSIVEIPTNETNLIYKTIKHFFDLVGKEMPGIKIIQEDNIPLTRGLGSSAACIVAGILAGDKLAGTNMSKKQLAEIAAKLEGHPDNSTPAIMGGMVVGALTDEKLSYVKIDVPDELQFNVMIPQFPLSTEKARGVIPQDIKLKDAVFNLSRTGLLVASIMTKDFDNLKVAMTDTLHQKYRMPIIPNMDKIFEKANELGDKASYLSGAGPTLISITHNNPEFEKNMKSFLKTLDNEWEFVILKPDQVGATITEL